MLDLLIVIAAFVCAFEVMRARRLMLATLWLACTSAIVAILLYRLGAAEVAVMELSVGAGLVTVLFVFAFSIVGESTEDLPAIIPRPLVWALVLLPAVLLGFFLLPVNAREAAAPAQTFTAVLWEQRGLDVLAQIVLIFSGVMGLLGLLAESRLPVPVREPTPAGPEPAPLPGELTTGPAPDPGSGPETGKRPADQPA